MDEHKTEFTSTTLSDSYTESQRDLSDGEIEDLCKFMDGEDIPDERLDIVLEHAAQTGIVERVIMIPTEPSVDELAALISIQEGEGTPDSNVLYAALEKVSFGYHTRVDHTRGNPDEVGEPECADSTDTESTDRTESTSDSDNTDDPEDEYADEVPDHEYVDEVPDREYADTEYIRRKHKPVRRFLWRHVRRPREMTEFPVGDAPVKDSSPNARCVVM